MASSLSSAGSLHGLDNGGRSGSAKQPRAPVSDYWRPSTGSQATAAEKKTTAFVSAAELQRNIEQVKNLPDYPR
jgi:hypothetical protein